MKKIIYYIAIFSAIGNAFKAYSVDNKTTLELLGHQLIDPQYDRIERTENEEYILYETYKERSCQCPDRFDNQNKINLYKVYTKKTIIRALQLKNKTPQFEAYEQGNDQKYFKRLLNARAVYLNIDNLYNKYNKSSSI